MRVSCWPAVRFCLFRNVFILLLKDIFAGSRYQLSISDSLNAEFQRIARGDNKAFLSDQSKEIEENNRVGKTGDLFMKIRDTKGIFHAKMGSIKNRNSINLTEAKDIKKR